MVSSSTDIYKRKKPATVPSGPLPGGFAHAECNLVVLAAVVVPPLVLMLLCWGRWREGVGAGVLKHATSQSVHEGERSR